MFLGAVGECQVVMIEPGKEPDGGGDLVAGVAGGEATGGAGACCSSAEATHRVPGRECVHQPSMLGIVDVGDGGGDPVFESGEGLVAFGEGAVGDEELADVAGGSGSWVGVEGLVGQLDRA